MVCISKRPCTRAADQTGGIATAPAIVIGYLMWKFSWNFDRALSYVQSKRYCVSPMSVSLRQRELLSLSHG